jgi:hypothetical protein
VLFPKATRGFEPISYRGTLVSTLLHATVYMLLHNLLNVLLGLQKKLFVVIFSHKLFACKSCSLLTHEALNLFIWRCVTEHSSSCL